MHVVPAIAPPAAASGYYRKLGEPMKNYQKVAAAMYAAYCKAAGGSTQDGQPLPPWSALGDNRQACWVAAAKQAAVELAKMN